MRVTVRMVALALSSLLPALLAAAPKALPQRAPVHRAQRIQSAQPLPPPAETIATYSPMDDPGWDLADFMDEARSYFTATLLQNGKVFVAGGFDGTDLLLSTEIYDPFMNAWGPSDSLGGVRASHTATLLRNGRVLIAGGDDGDNYLSSFALYDPGTDTCSLITTSHMIDQRENHTATLLSDGKVLVVGGFGNTPSETIFLDTAEVYDPADNSWTAVDPMGIPRASHTASLLRDGKVLVVGGTNEEYPNGIPSAQLFNPADGTWGSVLPLSDEDGRVGHAATVLPDGKVLVVGGSGASSYLSTAEIFDPTVSIWSATTSMSGPRFGHTATLLPNGQVIVVGGTSDGGDALESTELFNPSGPSWSSGGLMEDRRNLHSAVLLPNGKVLVAGGVGVAGPQDSAELYTPSTAGPYSGGIPSVLSLNVSSICLGADYLEATGSGFQGLSECSGGNGGQNSSTNYPLLQIHSLVDSTDTYLLGDPAHLWSDTTFRSVVIDAGALTPGGAQARIVTNGIASDPISITINAAPSVNSGSPADPSAICSGATATLTVAATGTGLSYQWYRGTAPDTTDPVGTNSNSYTTATLTSTTAYWVQVAGTCGSPQDSRTATVTVNQPANITSQPESAPVCSGSGTTLSVTATGYNLSYQWYQGAAPSTATPVGTNSNSYETGNLSSTTSYWVRVTGGCGSPADSATATVTVNANTSITSGSPVDPTAICTGTTATLTVAATGSGLNYQWYRGTAPSTTDPVGTDSSSYTTATLSATTPYWVRVTGSCGTADSRTVTVTVIPAPAPTISGASANMCPSTTVDLSTQDGMTDYQWYVDTILIEGATSSSHTATASGTYTVSYSNGCGTGTSAGHAVTVTGCAPPPETAPGNTPATAQSWSGKTTITWPVNSGATSGYHVYRGVKADLPNLLGGGTDSCTRATTPDASSNSATGIEEVPSGVAGRFYWYLITGLNWTEGTAGNATAGERTLNSSGACP